MEKLMRELRILHGVFLVSMIAIVAVGELVPIEAAFGNEANLVAAVLAFMALADLTVGFFMRSSMLESAREAYRKNPKDDSWVRGWRGGNFIAFVFAETVVLFGMVVRITSGSREFALPFYIVGVAVLILWTPRRPE